jgi:hypothetical protein
MRGWISLVFVAIAAAAIARPAEGGAMVCGGVGSDERASLASHAQGANLALEFFAERGAYIADVEVSVAPLGADRPALRNVADGPICYVKLPAGSYRIEATFNGVTRSARATLPDSPVAPVRVALGFPDPSSRDERIAPSPEERQQARQP